MGIKVDFSGRSASFSYSSEKKGLALESPDGLLRAEPSWLDPLPAWVGESVVVDLSGPFVCIGTLAAVDSGFLTLVDVDFHDLRDSKATRESYVIDSRRVGIRRNRARALVKLSEVVAVTRFEDID